MNKHDRKPIRNQHYYFVQKVLFNSISDYPSLCFDTFSNEVHRKFLTVYLKKLWDFTYSEIQNNIPDEPEIEIDELPYLISKIDELRTIAVITLPQPQTTAESYFVGLYFEKQESSSVPVIRYFTLEFHDSEKTALCELKEGRHNLLDINDNLSSEEFLEKIKTIVIK